MAEIILYEEHTGVFLIAPHAVETEPMDDMGTAALVRKIQEQTGFSALINTLYRKPEGKPNEKPKKERNYGKPDPQNGFANLNKVKQAEKVKDYITKIKKIVDTDGLTYVIWVHGIADENIKEFGDDVQCLIGYGQPGTKDPSPSYTAEQQFIDLLKKELNEKGIKSILAPAECEYRGWSEDYMNQWFLLKKYDFKKVQSVQLEFKRRGCRDTDESIETTAKKLAYAISAVVQTAAENNQSSDKAQVPEIISDPEEVKDAIEVGKSVSPIEKDEKVEEAYNHIRDIFVEKLQETMLEVGKYLINHFYDGKHEDAEKKPFSHNKSLNRLFKKLQENAFGNAPRKTWLYDAINLAIGEEKFNKVSAYGKLGHSHKIRLVSQKKLSRETKIQLMEQTVNDNLTVSQLQEKINEQKSGETIELDEPFSMEKLLKYDIAKLNTIKKRTADRKENVLKHLKTYDNNLILVDKVIKSKPKVAKKEPKKKASK
jgi:hypothetical protein